MAGTAHPMGERERNEDSGQFSEEYARPQFIEAISAIDGLATTSDVAEHVGCAHDTAYKKLQQLEADGEVTSRKAGNALLWSLVEE